MFTAPTVGRKLWYFPHDEELANQDIAAIGRADPLDATVVAVLPLNRINVVVFDAVGYLHRKLNLQLVQDGEEPPPAGGYCVWMPYQVKQHEKNANA